MYRPTVSQVFPNPLTRQWPSTSNPVSCECQQLYALVCLCCCVPKTHLLVLHEGESSNMLTSMPKGPKYVEFKVTPRTTAEDLSSFLYRAEFASASGNPPAAGSARSDESQRHKSPRPPPLDASTSFLDSNPFSPISPSNSSGSVSPRARSKASSISYSAVGATVHSHSTAAAKRQVIVVCLHGISVASAAVHSVLMDVLQFAQVWYSGRARPVPSLRLVAYCEHRSCVSVLPESLRATFAFSTFMSGLSMDSAVVLQCTDPQSSNIVNKQNMQEVMNTPDGLSLVKTVTLSSAVARYFRHLLLVVQGSLQTELAPGTLLLRKITYFQLLLKMAALLFMPADEVLARRTNPRSLLRGSSNFWSMEHATNVLTSRSSHHRSGSNAPGVAPNSDPFACNKDDSGRVLSLSHVVVSPSDVICLLPALITHTMSMHRSLVSVSARVNACRQVMAGGSVPLLTELSSRTVPSAQWSSRRIGVQLPIEDSDTEIVPPGLWDARVASLALEPRSRTAAISAAIAYHRQKFYHSENGSPVGGDAPAGTIGATMRTNPLTVTPTLSFAAQQRLSLPTGSDVQGSRQEPASPDTNAFNEAFRTAPETGVLAQIHTDETDFNFHDFLNYCEMREVVRSTLVCRSRPAPA